MRRGFFESEGHKAQERHILIGVVAEATTARNQTVQFKDFVVVEGDWVLLIACPNLVRPYNSIDFSPYVVM